MNNDAVFLQQCVFFPSISKSVLVRFWYSLRWWQLPFWSKLGVDFGAPEVCSNCRLFAYFTPPPSFSLSFHSIFKYFSQFFTLSRPLSFAFYLFTLDELLCFWNHNFSLLHSVFLSPLSLWNWWNFKYEIGFLWFNPSLIMAEMIPANRRQLSVVSGQNGGYDDNE